METRCGSCEKLFRVSDDKITGAGIKFPCTRCGKDVRITREAFEHYTMSQSAVSVLDLFEPKPQPTKPPLTPEAAEPAAEENAAPAPGSTVLAEDLVPNPEDTQEKQSPPSVELEEVPSTPAAELEPVVELEAVPFIATEQKAGPSAEPKAEPRSVPIPEPVEPAFATAPPTEPQTRPAVPKKETSRPAVSSASPAKERSVKESPVKKPPVVPSTPSRSGRMLLVLFGVLLIAGLAAYGIFVYLQSPSKEKKETISALISNEGLHVVNSGGALQGDGDLLITGVIRNATEKQRADWYVVTEVYDAQGAVLARIRLLNGKQIFSRRDYDILAERGENVQELKAKNLQKMNVVIPPKGTVSIEMRYLKPLAAVASFNTQVFPFDPVQLAREISGEIR